MDAFLRLLRYARAHRGLIAGAVLAMVVYGAASAALAWLIKPIVDDVLPTQDKLGFVVTALLIAYFFKGLGAYFSSYLMDDIGQRVVREIRNDLFRHLLNQSAAFFATRTTGQLLSRINNDVGQVQRAVSETVGDLARESLALVGYAGAAVLLRRQAGARLHDRGAAGRLSARPPRQAGAHGDALEPGGAGAHVARRRRGVRRPPHRQGVRRRGARGQQVRAARRRSLYRTNMKVTRVLSILPPLMELLGGVAIAGALWYGSREIAQRPAHGGRVHARSSPRC